MAEDIAAIIVSGDFVQIFLIGTLLLVGQAISRALTKSDIFSVRSTADQVTKRAASFECARLGVELSYLGFATYLFVGVVAIKHLDLASDEGDMLAAVTIVILQLVILLLAILATKTWNSAERSFKRGICIPNAVGFLSVLISLAVFFYVWKGGAP